jgi:hypothetical protein
VRQGHRWAAILAPIALATTPAAGQTGTPVPAAAAQGSAPTPLDRFGFLQGSQFQVSTGTDDDNATLSIKLPSGPSQRDIFSLVASTPIHGDDNALPASLDALANGSRVTLRWGRFEIGRAVPNPRAIAIYERARQRCLTAHQDDQNAGQVGGICSGRSDALVHDYPPPGSPPETRAFNAALLTSGATDYGLDATVGINDFEWVSPTTLAHHTEQHTDWSVAGHIAHYFVPTKTALTASVSYQRAYKAADEQQLCPPNPVNPATDCVTAHGAAPSRNEHLLVSIGLRHQFMVGGGLLPLAIAPAATYDAIDDVFGVDVPVYLMPGADGRLTGGIRFGYRSDRDNHFSVAAFVGAAFSILQ